MPKISIIVPIYNVEKYLTKCIDSVLDQTFQDFELLLINDGSRDTSGLICDNYAKKDSRIKVFHKENGGVSTARNVGIRNAQGDYTIHLDGDDYIENTMLKDMYQATNGGVTDIVFADFFIDDANQSTYKVQSIPNTPEECICYILDGFLHGSICNKLIKTEIFKTNNISFDEDIIMCEDLLFVIKCLLRSHSINKVNDAYLHYVQRQNSCIKSWSIALFDSYVRVAKRVEEITNNKYKIALNNFNVQIKKDMLLYGDVPQEVFYQNKCSSITILRHPSISNKAKILLVFANFGLYNIIKYLLNRIT